MIKKWQDFEGTWKQYLKYLWENGALSPEIAYKYTPKQIRTPYKD